MQDLINSKTNCLFIALWWTVKSTSPWGNWTLKNKKEKILYKWKISKYTAHMAIKNIEYIQWKYSRCNPAVREQAYKNWKLIHDHLFLYLTQTHTFALLSILRTRKHTYTLITKRTSAYKPAVSLPAQSQMFNPVFSHLKLVSWLASHSLLNCLSLKLLQPEWLWWRAALWRWPAWLCWRAGQGHATELGRVSSVRTPSPGCWALQRCIQSESSGRTQTCRQSAYPALCWSCLRHSSTCREETR